MLQDGEYTFSIAIDDSFKRQGVGKVLFQKVKDEIRYDLPNGLKKGQVLRLSGRSEFEFSDGTISKIIDIS